MRKRRPAERRGQPSSCEQASRPPLSIPPPTSRPSQNARSNSAGWVTQGKTTYDAPRGRESHHRAVTCTPAHSLGRSVGPGGGGVRLFQSPRPGDALLLEVARVFRTKLRTRGIVLAFIRILPQVNVYGFYRSFVFWDGGACFFLRALVSVLNHDPEKNTPPPKQSFYGSHPHSGEPESE